MNIFNEINYIPQLSVDCVIFGYEQQKLKVLVCKMVLGENIYTLPGGFIRQNQSIDEAAKQILKERTSLQNIFLEQFRVFGASQRTNETVVEILKNQEHLPQILENKNWFTKRFVSIGFYALVDINKIEPKTGEFDEAVDWYDVKSLPEMIIDHNEMVAFALETLRQNLDQKLIGFNLLPETFTMREVQELYEAVYDKPFARNNFQKKILDLNVLERLEKKFTGAANKAPYLYRFKR